MQITDPGRGAALAKTLGDGPLALMRGHGNVVVGSSVKQATVFAAYTDINARMQAQAMQLDSNIVVMDEPELFGPSEFDINRPWENFRQKLLSDSQRSQIDRKQFGLDHTQ
jgi:HCOMODA/2-hydroxy-3-carboxy-muconic semialdehyde decarboxylase